MRKIIVSLAAVAAIAMGASAANAAGGGEKPPQESWSWTGYFGSFDKASAQRGLQVYNEVCSSCHGLDLVAYRNLTALGYSEAQVKAYASEFTVIDGPNDEGEMFERPAKPADRFVNPFENANAARAANGGAFPPDFSLLVKARAGGHGNIPYNFTQWMAGRGTASGADYIYNLLVTGYMDEAEAEAYMRAQWDEKKENGELNSEELKNGFKFHYPEGKSFNKWFPGHAISMAPPVDDDAVEYADGTPATKEQIARDISTFLAWASEPELEHRKQMGWSTILFLIVLLGLAIAAKRRRWEGVKK